MYRWQEIIYTVFICFISFILMRNASLMSSADSVGLQSTWLLR